VYANDGRKVGTGEKWKSGDRETVRQLLLQEVKRKTAFENGPGATISIRYLLKYPLAESEDFKPQIHADKRG